MTKKIELIFLILCSFGTRLKKISKGIPESVNQFA